MIPRRRPSSSALGTDGHRLYDALQPTTDEQKRSAGLFAADSSIRHGWTDDLPDVLAALGLTQPNPEGSRP